jgi:hypothetical protein
LSADELNSYRDAWRLAQNKSAYLDIVGYHGCPRYYCHRDTITFLAWHREYVLRLEAVLGQPLHYWDWADSTAASTGIPRAFTDSTYVSPADGATYANPLFAFSFDCGGQQTTFRDPDNPANLAAFAAAVRTSYGATSYSSFNASINVPHGSVHTWTGGQMFNPVYASYDPIFWAHHSNVDRQWASWQLGGGPDPTSSQLSRALFGFAGRTINDVKDFSSLGYEYDRYDLMPSRPFVPFQLAAEREVEPLRAASGQGIGKTFNVPGTVSAALTLERAAPQPLYLYVGGIPEHPAQSYYVYVFINQPSATPEDAKASNPHFAGTFGVFGSVQNAAQAIRHEEASPRRVLQLFAGKTPMFREPISQITLVVTGEGRKVIPANKIPFDSAVIRQAGTNEGGNVNGGAEARNPMDTQTGARQFTGTSQNESYDEAYRDAANQAYEKLSGAGADRIIGIEVLSVTGQRGGIAGLRTLSITIRAWVKEQRQPARNK